MIEPSRAREPQNISECRVFDVWTSPGQYLNSAAAEDASATTLAAADMRA